HPFSRHGCRGSYGRVGVGGGAVVSMLIGHRIGGSVRILPAGADSEHQGGWNKQIFHRERMIRSMLDLNPKASSSVPAPASRFKSSSNQAGKAFTSVAVPFDCEHKGRGRLRSAIQPCRKSV